MCAFAGRGGERTLGPVETRSTRPLSEAEAHATVGLMDGLDLFALPRIGRQRGLDGSSWVLECRHAGAYHPLYRWSPDAFREARFRRAGDHLLALAGLAGKR